ncbi:hypothetical protein D3C78_1611460 [compost metagenome]
MRIGEWASCSGSSGAAIWSAMMKRMLGRFMAQAYPMWNCYGIVLLSSFFPHRSRVKRMAEHASDNTSLCDTAC